MYFLSAANETIAGVLPLLHTIYSTIIAKRYDRLAKYEDLSKDVLPMIEEIIQYAPQVYTFEDSDRKFREYLAPVKQLITLRNDVENKRADPPPVEAGRELLSEVSMTAGFLLGMVSTGLSMLVRGYILNSINIRKWTKKAARTKKGNQNRGINK